MTEQITIKQIYFNQARKDGTAYLDTKQRPYKAVKLIATDGRTLWGRAYDNSPLLSWKPGETHEVETEVNGDFTNFRLPKAASQGNVGMEISKINARLNSLEGRVLALEDAQIEPEDDETPF